MRLALSFLVASLAAALLFVQGAPAGSKATYYVSLGDSLAQGFQVTGGPPSPESPPGYNQGYADQLFKLVPRGRRATPRSQARLRRRDHVDDDRGRHLLPTPRDRSSTKPWPSSRSTPATSRSSRSTSAPTTRSRTRSV